MAASGSGATICAWSTGSARWGRPSSSSDAPPLPAATARPRRTRRPRPAAPGRRFRVLPILLAGIGLAAASALLARPAAAAEAAAATEAARRRVDVLTRHLALAKTGQPYLVLDVARKELRLEMAGAALRRWPITDLGSGRPRRLLKDVPPPAGWDLRSWVGGRLDPARRQPRIELDAPPPGGPAVVPPIPQPVQEAIPAPPSYLIRFEDGLAVEVRTPGARGGHGGLLATLRRDVGLLLGHGDRLRLRVVMDPADAAALYRSLPPEVPLLIDRGGD